MPAADDEEALQRAALGLRTHPRTLYASAGGSRSALGARAGWQQGSRGSSRQGSGEDDWRRKSGRAARVSYAGAASAGLQGPRLGCCGMLCMLWLSRQLQGSWIPSPAGSSPAGSEAAIHLRTS